MTEGKNDRSTRETLAIPQYMRDLVDERDRYMCRVCGRHLGRDRRAVHHIRYGGDLNGMGGRRTHDVNEMITLGWLPGDCQCHQLVHSNKHVWQPVLLVAASRPGVTALQLRRWARANGKKGPPDGS